MPFLDLPDEMHCTTFAYCGLWEWHKLERVCKRFKILISTNANLWSLAQHTYAKNGLGFRESYECIHAVRSPHMLRMLVGEIEARNDEERNGWPSIFHGADPLAGRSGADQFLFKTLCQATQKASLAGPQRVDALDEIALVLEIRRGTPQTGPVAGSEDPKPADPKPTHTWVLPASDDLEQHHVTFEMRRWRLAKLAIDSADEAGLLSFDADTFIVLWAVHRSTKAVALLHAAEPEGNQLGGFDRQYSSAMKRGELDDRNGDMHAASIVPRMAPVECVKLNEFLDGVGGVDPNGGRPHRDVATLVAHVNVMPVWEGSGGSDTDMLLHPDHAIDDEGLQYEFQDEIRTADRLATEWWVARVSIDLSLDGIECVGPPPEPPWMDPDQLGSDNRRSALFSPTHKRNMRAWYRNALLERLRSNVIWVRPRSIDHPEQPLTPGSGITLQHGVDGFLRYIMYSEYEIGDQDDEGGVDGEDGDAGGDGGGDEE